MVFRLGYTFLLCLICAITSNAQRFSLLGEAGALRTQVDGDKIQGFYYNGYVVGIGTNYAFNPENFLSVKTSYYSQGSRSSSIFQKQNTEGFQLETSFKSIGLELSYKYDPADRNYFLGLGVVQHQLLNFDYDVIKGQFEDVSNYQLAPDQITSFYTGFKIYGGFEVFDRAGIYFALESSLTNMLRSDFDRISSLIPYSLSAVFTYEIIASKVEPKPNRPGSKSRKQEKIQQKTKGRRFAY